jgi:hypothetical protein
MAQRCPKFHVQPTTKRFRTMMRGSARQAYMMPSFQYRSLQRFGFFPGQRGPRGVMTSHAVRVLITSGSR